MVAFVHEGEAAPHAFGQAAAAVLVRVVEVLETERVAEFVADRTNLQRLVVERLRQSRIFVECDAVQFEGNVLFEEIVVLRPYLRAGEDDGDAVHITVGIRVVVVEIHRGVGQAAGFVHGEMGRFVGVRTGKTDYGTQFERDNYVGI